MSSSDPIVLVTGDDQIEVIETDSDEVIVFRDGDTDVLVDASDVTILETSDDEMIVIVSEGERGPQGIPGTDGIGSAPFIWTQNTPAATWIMPHNRGHRVQVTLFDDLFNEVESDVVQGDLNTATATYALPATGSAVLT